MKTIAIIPVRSGSKRFPGKNFAKFCDTTLIENTIDKLRKAKIDDIIISSDNVTKAIKSLILIYSNLAFFDRPDNLAKDDSKVEDAIIDTIKRLEVTREMPEDYIIVLAQVTSPNWSPHRLIYAIHKLEEKKVDSVISISPDLKPNGAFYVFKKSTFLASKKIYSPNMYLIQLDWDENTDIDYEYQWCIAQTIARGNYDKT